MTTSRSSSGRPRRMGTAVVAEAAWQARVRERAEETFSQAAGGESLPRVRDDLFALAGLLRREPRLRKTLGDIGIPDEAKQGLMRALLQKRVDETTVRLVDSLIAEEGLAWRLPTVLEDLA